MKGDFINSKSEAQSQMRRSDMLWGIFEKTAHRVRYFAVLEAHYRYILRRELEDIFPRANLLHQLRYLADAAHDMMIFDKENMRSVAKQARGAEMTARIFLEEGQDYPRDDFALYQPETNFE